ncbi:MAG: alpha-ketoglutarate-dependent dioxygenase AlkB [Flavobacteriaceae bacterium]|nr:alpha-ketoglutarate-dependent dioxygenase AlkB [Flavobacteriaceae bacterium]
MSFIPLPDATIAFYPDFLKKNQANEMFESLYKETSWQQDPITVFGKTYPQPRLTALYGNNGLPYSYSNITMHPHPFTQEMNLLLNNIKAVCSTEFTSVLMNLYRNGSDSNGWHSDDEKELGADPVIASLSLGATRMFHLRHKFDKSKRHKMELTHGSLLLMSGKTQHFWQHQIPKTKKEVAPRINLTFRKITVVKK